MESIFKDFRFGFRMLIKNRTMSIISLITFALGIGLTTTVFSIVHGALLAGLPFEDADRIVVVMRTDVTRPRSQLAVSTHDYRDWEEQQTVFSAMAAYNQQAYSLIDSDGWS